MTKPDDKQQSEAKPLEPHTWFTTSDPTAFERPADEGDVRHAAGDPTMSERPADKGDVRHAVVVIHGMGQQVRFAALDRLAQGLARYLTWEGKAPSKPIFHARTTHLGGRRVHRLETTVAEEKVHLYEAYWAPLTEGKVTLRDVSSFLFSGARNALTNGFGPVFKRFAFGDVQKYDVPVTTFLGLLSALLFTCALWAINTAVLIGVCDSVLGFWGNDMLEWLAYALLQILLLLIALAIVCFLPFAPGLVLLRMWRKSRQVTALKLPLGYKMLLAALSGVVGVVGLATIGVGGLIVYVATIWLSEPSALKEAEWIGWYLSFVGQVVLWLTLGLGAWKARTALVRNLGDVAAYVSPHRLDRFATMRKDIRDAVLEVVQAVYNAQDNDKPYYNHVHIVGHSLGSVVAYDVLNRVLLRDEHRSLSPKEKTKKPSASTALSRTRLLLTFGSPLDKTAYIFRKQADDTAWGREALAASLQPLILDRRFRTFSWVNVHSSRDPISGQLDFYDPNTIEETPPLEYKRVDNVVDPLARTPLFAHTEYWDADAIYKHLLKAIRGFKDDPQKADAKPTPSA
ncbi:MAG: hypothetical protein RhofKO_32120 [Rhodothermales bacterium]